MADHDDDDYMDDDNYHVICQHDDCEKEVPEEEFGWLDDEGAWKLAGEEGWAHMKGEPPWMWLCPLHAAPEGYQLFGPSTGRDGGTFWWEADQCHSGWRSGEEAVADAQAHADRQRAIGYEQGKAEVRDIAMRRLRAVQLLTTPRIITREEDGKEYMIRCLHCNGYAYTDGGEPSLLGHKPGCAVLLARELCKVAATTPTKDKTMSKTKNESTGECSKHGVQGNASFQFGDSEIEISLGCPKCFEEAFADLAHDYRRNTGRTWKPAATTSAEVGAPIPDCMCGHLWAHHSVGGGHCTNNCACGGYIPTEGETDG